MPLKPKQVRVITGVGLALMTLLTRLPFMAKTFFEFDSIDFAVATFRFSLEQVTPHMPGYIGHILLGRLFTLFTGDINQAFVWLSTTLSILSVILMWRAGAQLRGERVGLVAAVLWLFTPLFWFYGEVATAYIHEALFASLILYLALKLLREPRHPWLLTALALALSISGSMRQNSILFFLPVIAYVAWKTMQPWKNILQAAIAFIIMTGAWVMILLSESGGLNTYLFYASKETIFKSQSMLFGNSFSVHAAVAAKMLFYLLAAVWPILMVAVAYCFSRRRKLAEIKDGVVPGGFIVLALTAIPPFLFYLLVYFMKAGYLLNVVPSIVLLGAVLVDELAISYAKQRKEREEERFALTRKIITKSAIVLTSVISAVNIAWFLLPLPGKQYSLFADGVTAASFGNDLSDRMKSGSSTDRLLNRAFAYTSAQGVSMTDSINQRMLRAINPNDSSRTIIDTWWSRWNYIYSPQYPVYDVITFEDRLQMGLSRQHDRVPLLDKDIYLTPTNETLLLIRPDHPDLKQLREQASLITIDSVLGVYRFSGVRSLTWKDRTFHFAE
jgi:hypothetical protein